VISELLGGVGISAFASNKMPAGIFLNS